MKKEIWVIHVLAECQDCGKQFENYKNGQALAAKHAKHYQHLVTGEIGLAFNYNGKEGKQK